MSAMTMQRPMTVNPQGGEAPYGDLGLEEDFEVEVAAQDEKIQECSAKVLMAIASEALAEGAEGSYQKLGLAQRPKPVEPKDFGLMASMRATKAAMKLERETAIEHARKMALDHQPGSGITPTLADSPRKEEGVGLILTKKHSAVALSWDSDVNSDVNKKGTQKKREAAIWSPETGRNLGGVMTETNPDLHREYSAGSGMYGIGTDLANKVNADIANERRRHDEEEKQKHLMRHREQLRREDIERKGGNFYDPEKALTNTFAPLVSLTTKREVTVTSEFRL